MFPVVLLLRSVDARILALLLARLEPSGLPGGPIKTVPRGERETRWGEKEREREIERERETRVRS
jgi:hypothetical protein